MAGRRRWSRWPSRIASELNGMSGVAGVGGTAMGVAGWAGVAGTTATVLMSGGAALAVGAVGYAVYKAVPPVLRTPEDVVGHTIDLSELDDVDPPVLRLAVVGPTKAGKTTLKARLSFKGTPDERTQKVTAYVVSVPSNPPRYVAILDGGGERLAQQFKISEPADCLCLILDHNISDTDTTIDDERLKEHTEFLTQIRYHLKDARGPRKKWIEILINKRDLWEQASDEQKDAFKQFYVEEVGKWSADLFSDSVASNPHSNEIPDDIGRFMSQLAATVAQ